MADQKENLSTTPENTGKKIEISTNEIKKSHMDEIFSSLVASNNLSEFAHVSHDVLKDEFSVHCTVKIKETSNGFFKISITDKNIQEKSVPQIEITVTKDFRYNIHLNDYEHFEEYYYFGEKLSNKELFDEMRNFNAFLLGQSMSENTKLKKEEYF